MATLSQGHETNDADTISRLKLELDHLKSENDNLRTELYQAGENLKCSQANNLQLNSVITNLHDDLQQKTQQIDMNISEKFELGHMIEVKNREILKLKEKISELDNTSFERFEELNNSLSNAKQKEIRLNFQEKMLLNEKELHEKQIDFLGKQLAEKSNELLNLQTELRNLNSTLNEKIINQNSEISALSSENTRLKTMLDICEKNISETFARYQELIKEHSSMKNVFEQQSELLQNRNKTLQENIDELQRKLEGKEQKLKDVYQLFEDQSKIHDQLEERFHNMKTDLFSQIESLQKENHELKQGSVMNTSIRSRIATSNNVKDISGRSASISGDNIDFSNQQTSEYLQQIHELENENRLLSIQVQYLLKSGIELKGIPVFHGNKRNLSSVIRIPEDQITVADIGQLQERNIELLKTLQIYYEDSETNALKEEIESLKIELEDKKQLLQKSDSYSWERKNHELAAEVKRLNNELQQCLKMLEESRASSFEEIRKLEEIKNCLMEENIIQKANLLTLTAENDMNKKNLESLENIKNEIHSENISLRERERKLTSVNENLRLNTEVLKEDLQAQEESVRKASDELVDLKAQLVSLRNNETVFLFENAKLKEELENIKHNPNFSKRDDNNSNFMNSEAREIMKAQIEELKNNNKYYREKIDRQEEKLSSKIQDFSNKIEKFQTLLEKEKARYTALQKEFFDLDIKYQELLEKNAQTKANIACSDENDDPFKAAGHDIYRLKEMIKIADDRAAANEKIKLKLEEGIQSLVKKHTEELDDMQKKIDAKQEVIDELKGQLLQKDKEIDSVAAEKDVSIGKLREEIKQWKEEVDNLNNVAEVNHRSMEQILTEQEKIMLESNGLRQLNTQLKNRIDNLQEELDRSEAALKVYKENTFTWESDLNNSGLNSSNNETIEKENASLKEYSEILLWQLEELKTKVNLNDSTSSNDENGEQGLMKVVKFLREKLDEAQKSLRNALSEMNSIKVQNSNLNKEIEQLKISMKKTSSSVLNENALKELYGKASLAEMLSAKNAKLNIEFQRYQGLVRTMNLKIERAEKYQDEAQDLIQKARERAIENQALKNEILNYKKRMAKLETRMSQVSVETFEALCNEKEELEKKIESMEPELIDLRAKSIDLNRKYLALKANLKTLENKSKAEKAKLENDLSNSQEEIKSLNAKFQQHVTNSQAKSSEAIDGRIVALQNEVDNLRKESLEKEGKLKTLADKAKEKISFLASEKEKIIQELASKQEEIENLKTSVKNSSNLSTNIHMPSTSQSFDSKESTNKNNVEFSRTPSTVSVAPVQAEVFKPPMASIKPTVAEPRSSPARTNVGKQTAAVTPNVEESSVSIHPQVVTIQPNPIQTNPSRNETVPTQCVQVSEASTSFFVLTPPINTSSSSSNVFPSKSTFDNNAGEKRTLDRTVDEDECSSSKRAKVTDEEMLEYNNEDQNRADELMASSEEEVEINDDFDQQRNAPEMSSEFGSNQVDNDNAAPSQTSSLTTNELPSAQADGGDVSNENELPEPEVDPESGLPEAGTENEEALGDDLEYDDEEDYDQDLDGEDQEDEDDDDGEHDSSAFIHHEGSAEEDEEAEDEEEDKDEDEQQPLREEVRSTPEIITLSDSEDEHAGNEFDNMDDDDNEGEEDDENDNDEDDLVVDDAEVQEQRNNAGVDDEDAHAEQGQGISSSNANLNDPQHGNESQTSSNAALTTTTNDDGSQVQFQNIQPSYSFASLDSQFFSPNQQIFQSNQPLQQFQQHLQQQIHQLQQQQHQQHQQPDSHEESERISSETESQQTSSQRQQQQSVIISQSSTFTSQEDNDAQPSESVCSTDHSNDRNDVATSSTQATQIGGPNSSSGQDELQPIRGSSDREASSPEPDNSANRGTAKPRRGFRRGNYGF